METVHEKAISFFRFEDLRIYHKSLEYITFLNTRLKQIPFEHHDMLALPFYAAGRNIAKQVAEGSSRNKNQFIYFLKLAKTSIRECVILTSICQKAGYFSEQDVEQSRYILMELTKMIGALIISLTRAGVKEFAPVNDPSIMDDDLDLATFESP